MMARIFTLLPLAALVACGGGGGGSDGGASAPPPAQPAAVIVLPVVDSIPAAGITVDPEIGRVEVSHESVAGASYQSLGACRRLRSTERALLDLSLTEFDTLVTHTFDCDTLAENDSVELRVEFAANGSRYEVRHEFATGVASAKDILVQSALLLPGPSLEAFVADYLAQTLVADLDLPAVLVPLLAAPINEVVTGRLPALSALRIAEDVRLEFVTYASVDPDGAPSDRLSGLIARPENPRPALAKDRLVVLMHATGATPSELAPTDAWVLLAGILASRGYVVVAPDNWGRGATNDEPETYLIGSRTAKNAADFIEAVLADPQNETFFSTDDPQIDVVGYSQGGHSAIALWSLLEGVPANVYLGGGPYNLYATFAGVVEADSGRCQGGAYCDLVGLDTALPFVSGRILPGYLAYLDIGLNETDVLDGTGFAGPFVDAFLDDGAPTDRLKRLLQRDSYRDVLNTTSSTRFFTYHSNFDRLVPAANQDDLIAGLPAGRVDDRSSICNTQEFATIFALTDFVGINHALCGIVMIDEVVNAYP